MSSYPIKASRVSLDHHGGTKSYHIILVETADGLGLLVKRWGKTGQFGDMKSESYATYREAEKAFERVFNEKTRKGYAVTGKTVEATANDQHELPGLFGRLVWAKLDAGAIQHICPLMDVADRRQPDPPAFDEDGEFLGKPKPRLLSPQELEEARRLEAEEKKRQEQAGYASNPLYGMF
ncbi:WGR domain-containing protein [Mesorhizobium sp. M0955]|uniref:WGR domain-containing protein n=1 Tax=Mesorhizobium sp. M0955 TaxID=2957033 RepID=UPI0033372033